MNIDAGGWTFNESHKARTKRTNRKISELTMLTRSNKIKFRQLI